jgi:hypothetical protein
MTQFGAHVIYLRLELGLPPFQDLALSIQTTHLLLHHLQIIPVTVQTCPGLRQLMVYIRITFHHGVVHLQHISMKTFPLLDSLPPKDPGLRFQMISLCTSGQPTVKGRARGKEHPFTFHLEELPHPVHHG